MVADGYSCHETSFGVVAVKAYKGDFNWDEAWKKCSWDGTSDGKGELPAPRSSAENEWFVNKAKQLGLSNFWLGITDKGREGTWTSQHNVPQGYFNWAAGEPNNQGNQDCAQAGGSWPGFSWDDDFCTKKIHLLCTYTGL